MRETSKPLCLERHGTENRAPGVQLDTPEEAVLECNTTQLLRTEPGRLEGKGQGRTSFRPACLHGLSQPIIRAGLLHCCDFTLEGL